MKQPTFLQRKSLQSNQTLDFAQFFKQIDCPFAESEWNVRLYESVFTEPKAFLLEWNEPFSSSFCSALSEKLRLIHQGAISKSDERQRVLSTLGRLMVFYLLQKEYGIESPRLEWEKESRPFLFESPLSFNVSHSGNLCACAFARTSVGVDVQRMDDKRFLQLAKRFFLSKEYALIADCSPDERKKLFYWLWTRKESYLKSKGKGLSFLLKDIDYGSGNFLSFSFKEYILSICR